MRLDFCTACGSKNDLHHHHLIIRCASENEDDPSSVTLCTGCHDRLHERQWPDTGLADTIIQFNRGIEPDGTKFYTIGVGQNVSEDFLS